MTKHELNRYYRQIEDWMPCRRSQRKQILAQIKENVARYLSESPDADIKELETHFGRPQVIAAAYVDELNTAQIVRSLRTRRKLVAVVGCCAVALVLVWGTAVTALSVFHLYDHPAYIEVTVSSGEEYQTMEEIYR